MNGVFAFPFRRTPPCGCRGSAANMHRQMKRTVTNGAFAKMEPTQLLIRTLRKPVSQLSGNSLAALNKGPT